MEKVWTSLALLCGVLIGRAGASPPSRATGARHLYIYIRATV